MPRRIIQRLAVLWVLSQPFDFHDVLRLLMLVILLFSLDILSGKYKRHFLD